MARTSLILSWARKRVSQESRWMGGGGGGGVTMLQQRRSRWERGGNVAKGESHACRHSCVGSHAKLPFYLHPLLSAFQTLLYYIPYPPSLQGSSRTRTVQS